jgi:hypothetical protein
MPPPGATSRFSDWSEWAEEVALDLLPPAEAVLFLERRAGREDEEGAKAPAAVLGCLPLGLDHAAAYCKRTQTSFADYAAKAGSLIAATPRRSAYPRSVATFDLAIAEAVKQCPAAEPLMAYLGQCAPERIPVALVEGAIKDEAERAAALLALTEISRGRHSGGDGTPARAGGGPSAGGGDGHRRSGARTGHPALGGDFSRGRLPQPGVVATMRTIGSTSPYHARDGARWRHRNCGRG